MFGAVAASPGGQEWVGRFLAKDPAQSSLLTLPPPEEGEEPPVGLLRVDPDLERAQVERVRALRARRDPGPWRAALDAVEARARSGGNLVPAMVDAVLAGTTVGEIAGRLRGVFGEHRERLDL